MASRMEQILEALANGETLDFVPMSRNEALLKQIMENGVPGGGGGSSAPSDWNANEGEPGHILNRPFYTEKAVDTALDTTASFNEEFGGFICNIPVWLYTGEEYTVLWNGTEYKCPCIEMADGETVMQILGNFGAMSGGESTGEPFVALIVPHVEDASSVSYTALFVPLDGSERLSVSITGMTLVVHELDKRYVQTAITELENEIKSVQDGIDYRFPYDNLLPAGEYVEAYAANGALKAAYANRLEVTVWIDNRSYTFRPQFYVNSGTANACVIFDKGATQNTITKLCCLKICVFLRGDSEMVGFYWQELT